MLLGLIRETTKLQRGGKRTEAPLFHPPRSVFAQKDKKEDWWRQPETWALPTEFPYLGGNQAMALQDWQQVQPPVSRPAASHRISHCLTLYVFTGKWKRLKCVWAREKCFDNLTCLQLLARELFHCGFKKNISHKGFSYLFSHYFHCPAEENLWKGEKHFSVTISQFIFSNLYVSAFSLLSPFSCLLRQKCWSDGVSLPDWAL